MVGVCFNPVMPGLFIVTSHVINIERKYISFNPVMPGLFIVTQMIQSIGNCQDSFQSRYAGTIYCNLMKKLV